MQFWGSLAINLYLDQNLKQCKDIFFPGLSFWSILFCAASGLTFARITLFFWFWRLDCKDFIQKNWKRIFCPKCPMEGIVWVMCAPFLLYMPASLQVAIYFMLHRGQEVCWYATIRQEEVVPWYHMRHIIKPASPTQKGEWIYEVWSINPTRNYNDISADKHFQ